MYWFLAFLVVYLPVYVITYGLLLGSSINSTEHSDETLSDDDIKEIEDLCTKASLLGIFVILAVIVQVIEDDDYHFGFRFSLKEFKSDI